MRCLGPSTTAFQKIQVLPSQTDQAGLSFAHAEALHELPNLNLISGGQHVEECRLPLVEFCGCLAIF